MPYDAQPLERVRKQAFLFYDDAGTNATNEYDTVTNDISNRTPEWSCIPICLQKPDHSNGTIVRAETPRGQNPRFILAIA
jgi:hypothetical protein